MAERPLTDLESVALGCVAWSGPCTAYVIRRMFLDAPSARFSGSAGAIYPMLRRLEERGFLRSADAPTGERPARAYSITAKGRHAIKRWLREPLDPAAGFADDPFRTRMMFLDQLEPAERLAWLDAADACIRAQDEIIAAHEDAHPGDPWIKLGHDNARRINRARLQWIAAARKIIADL